MDNKKHQTGIGKLNDTDVDNEKVQRVEKYIRIK